MADLISKKIVIAEYKLSLNQDECDVLYALLSVASTASTNEALKGVNRSFVNTLENDVTFKLYEFFKDNT